jgi:hypothetical protein
MMDIHVSQEEFASSRTKLQTSHMTQIYNDSALCFGFTSREHAYMTVKDR